ncbi:hypothetical protein RUM43_001054 [Polyplax serrata]|uniref:Uncharacterized protein n=1 Tax=Polyplax serrata TaxID=468196 RepID=A0AAN8SFN2_POLSC
MPELLFKCVCLALSTIFVREEHPQHRIVSVAQVQSTLLGGVEVVQLFISTQYDIQAQDRKTINLPVISEALHPKANVYRQHVNNKEKERGFS